MPKKGYKQIEEHKYKQSISKMGHKVLEETKQKISEKLSGENHPNYGKHLSKETKIKIGIGNLGKVPSEETKRKMSEVRKNKTYEDIFGPVKAKEQKEKRSLIQKNHLVSFETRKKISESRTGTHPSEITKKKMSKTRKISQYLKWQNKEYREIQTQKILNGLIKRPTCFEKKIADLCIENSLPFIYTGNGQFLINFKNPDFVNYKDKIVIEVFYSWFKIRNYGSVKNYIEFCRKKYEPAGWKVIFIDEKIMNDNNWKELSLNKLGYHIGK